MEAKCGDSFDGREVTSLKRELNMLLEKEDVH